MPSMPKDHTEHVPVWQSAAIHRGAGIGSAGVRTGGHPPSLYKLRRFGNPAGAMPDSPPDTPPAPRAAPMQRAAGHARLALASADGRVRLSEFYQQGCCKIRLPRSEPGRPLEAVLLNTSGGITGGDRLVYEVELGPGAEAVLTTQAAERVYRSISGPGHVENHLRVAEGATLDWLPQETILFDRAALDRRLEVDLAGDAVALLAETIVFGRMAMGEAVRSLLLADRWRVRRDGRLVFADGLMLDGDAEAVLGAAATASGARAVANLVLLADAAPARLADMRAVLNDCASEAGASAWPGVLNVRFVAQSGQMLRQDLKRVVEALRGRPMPRVWDC